MFTIVKAFFIRLGQKKLWLFCYLTLLISSFILAFTLYNWIPLSIIIGTIFALISIPISFLLSLMIDGIASLFSAFKGNKIAKEIASESPEIATLEIKRAKIKTRGAILSLVAVAVVVISLFVGDANGLIGGVIIGGILLICAYFVGKTDIDLDFKNTIVNKLLDEQFQVERFEPRHSISREEIRDLGLFTTTELLSGDDLLEAKRNDIVFCRSDLRIQKTEIRRGIGPNDDDEIVYIDIFSGYVIRFDLEEPFPQKLIAHTRNVKNLRNAPSNATVLFGNHHSSFESESMEYNQRFTTYCEDQLAARQILTPQRLLNLCEIANYLNKEIAMLFLENKVYLFVHSPSNKGFDFILSSQSTVNEQKEKITKIIGHLAELIDIVYIRQ